MFDYNFEEVGDLTVSSLLDLREHAWVLVAELPYFDELLARLWEFYVGGDEKRSLELQQADVFTVKHKN